jgi:hypothetical protein
LALQDEREALLEELEASKQRLTEAQDAAAAARTASHLSDRQLAALENELLSARCAGPVRPVCMHGHKLPDWQAS